MKNLLNRPYWLLLTVLCLQCGQPADSSQDNQPNVLLINVDDLGYGDVGAYGATMVKKIGRAHV